MNRGVRKSINITNFLKNSLGDNHLLNSKFVGENRAFERGITNIHNLSNPNEEKNEIRTFMIEKIQQEQLQKKIRRPRKDSKGSNVLPIITSKNEKLNAAYSREKRKLELDMLKLNSKLGTTAKILNLIRYDKSPTPNYKFKEFKEKINLMKKYRTAIKNKKGVDFDKLLLGHKKKKANNMKNSENSSIITEDVEPSQSEISF